MLTWFHLTIASVGFLSSYYFLSKRLFNQESDVDPRFYGICLQFTTGLIALPIAILSGFSFHLTLESAFFLLLMALAYTIAPSFYYTGLKHIDLSETTILDSSGVLWTLLLGTALLGEILSFTKILGILLVLSAILLVSYRPKKKLVEFSKYEIYLLIAPLFYALGAVLDNKLVGYSTAVSYMAVSFLSAGTMMFLFNVHRVKSAGKKTFKNINFWKTIGINSIFVFLTYFCIMLAYERGGEVSRMYAIGQIESVIVPLAAIFLLKERSRISYKIAAAIIAFAGLLLIKV